ncbi:hypothetical protein [Merismopedia glauca]|uniref:hypothetical protein n=1 Tax=Merismopedia glauca TaxID=292586 RepID=UPI0030D8E901
MDRVELIIGDVADCISLFERYWTTGNIKNILKLKVTNFINKMGSAIVQSKTIQLFLAASLAATLGACAGGNETKTDDKPTETTTPKTEATSTPKVTTTPKSEASPTKKDDKKEGGEGGEGE